MALSPVVNEPSVQQKIPSTRPAADKTIAIFNIVLSVGSMEAVVLITITSIQSRNTVADPDTSRISFSETHQRKPQSTERSISNRSSLAMVSSMKE
jgi:hypothetical protein